MYLRGGYDFLAFYLPASCPCPHPPHSESKVEADRLKDEMQAAQRAGLEESCEKEKQLNESQILSRAGQVREPTVEMTASFVMDMLPVHCQRLQAGVSFWRPTLRHNAHSVLVPIVPARQSPKP